MRMLKSGLKLVLDTEWIINEADSIIEDIIAKCNVYEGSKYYYHHSYDNKDYLQYFDVKLPLNHRYVMTYFNGNNEFAATVYFDTFGVEEQYQASFDTDASGYQAIGVWYYNIDDESVGGDSIAFNICDLGIRLNPIYMGNFILRIYQLD